MTGPANRSRIASHYTSALRTLFAPPRLPWPTPNPAVCLARWYQLSFVHHS